MYVGFAWGHVGNLFRRPVMLKVVLIVLVGEGGSSYRAVTELGCGKRA